LKHINRNFVPKGEKALQIMHCFGIILADGAAQK